MATTRQRGTIELRLVAVAPDGEAADLVVEAVPDAPARELVAAVAAELGLAEAPARVGGAELPGDAPLSELALRHGDVLDFGRRASPAAAAQRELVVAGGPEAGRRFPLAPGVHRVGREGALALDDPSLSAAHVVLAVAEDGAVTVADAGSRNGTAVEGVALEPGEERPLADGELVAAGRTLLAVESPALSEPHSAAAGDGLVRFNRPPRVQRPLEDAVRPFPAPPERPRRRAAAPPAPELVRRAQRLEPSLWERRPDDHDFLSLRIGSADRPALLALRLNDGGADELRREVEELGAWYSTAPAVPVTVPVAELGVVGVCGPRARVEALGRWLVAQAAALHSPRELALAAAVDSDDWEWMKWLPH